MLYSHFSYGKNDASIAKTTAQCEKNNSAKRAKNMFDQNRGPLNMLASYFMMGLGQATSAKHQTSSAKRQTTSNEQQALSAKRQAPSNYP